VSNDVTHVDSPDLTHDFGNSHASKSAKGTHSVDPPLRKQPNAPRVHAKFEDHHPGSSSATRSSGPIPGWD
jgi:hypothetical protein